jgi:hypothetical protein
MVCTKKKITKSKIGGVKKELYSMQEYLFQE